jgi:hypothetical protein
MLSFNVVLSLCMIMAIIADEGMTPRSSIFTYPVPAKEEVRSKDTRSPQGPALRLGVEGKKHFVNPNWLHI